MGAIVQVLENIATQGRFLGLAFIAIVAIGLVVVVFASHHGSITKVIVIVGCAMVAAVIVWQLPDLLKLAVSDAPNFTGVGGSRY
jgi:hypothetical protein